MAFVGIFQNTLVIPPPRNRCDRRAPLSLRRPRGCRHIPSARQHYDVPAKGRPSLPHLGVGGAGKSPTRGRLAPPPVFFRPCLLFVFSNTNYIKCLIGFWSLKQWTEPWTRDDKRACVNSKRNITRTNLSSVQPSPLAVRRIGNASAFRLAPGVAGDSKQFQIPPSPKSLLPTNRLPLACQVYRPTYCLHCCTAVLGRSVGGWSVVGGW